MKKLERQFMMKDKMEIERLARKNERSKKKLE